MNARPVLRLLRRSFAGKRIGSDPFRRVDRQFRQARLMVRAYYLLSILFSASVIPTLHDAAMGGGSWFWLWPVKWMAEVDILTTVDLLTLGWLISSIVAFVAPDSRIARCLAAIFLLQVAAVSNSLGGINHAYHAWFWISVILTFLPTAGSRPARATKLTYLSAIAGCQTLLLSFYTLAGFQKFGAGAVAFMHDMAGNFSTSSLSSTLADRMLQTGTRPLLAEVVIDNPLISQLLFLPIIFVQMMAVIIAFRPRLHAAWGLTIIGFHVGTWVLMEIIFIQHIALLALFLVASPFTPARMNAIEMIGDIPVIGPTLRWMLLALRPRRRLEAELPPAE